MREAVSLRSGAELGGWRRVGRKAPHNRTWTHASGAGADDWARCDRDARGASPADDRSCAARSRR